MALQLGYISLTIIMNVILFYIGVKTIDKTFSDPIKVKAKKTLLISSLITWQLYIFAIASTGMLRNFDFPPKFVLFLIFPAFLFTGIFIYKNRNNTWIQNIPKQWLIYYQTFRIAVEILLVFTATEAILHKIVTIEGYNFDMVFGFTAPIIAYFVFQKNTFTPKVAILWNYAGLVVLASIIFLFITGIFFPHLYGSDFALIQSDFGTYPYILLAGFLMPSAVFIHILSIVQLNQAPKSELN